MVTWAHHRFRTRRGPGGKTPFFKVGVWFYTCVDPFTSLDNHLICSWSCWEVRLLSLHLSLYISVFCLPAPEQRLFRLRPRPSSIERFSLSRSFLCYRPSHSTPRRITPVGYGNQINGVLCSFVCSPTLAIVIIILNCLR